MLRFKCLGLVVFLFVCIFLFGDLRLLVGLCVFGVFLGWSCGFCWVLVLLVVVLVELNFGLLV